VTADDSRLPDLGPRGEGWVAAQVILLAAIGLAGLVDLGRAGSPTSSGGLISVVGGVGVAAGLIVVGLAYAGLRSSFSPFPRPVAQGDLVDSGIYRQIRHPMYVGLVVVAIGWSLLTGSVLALFLGIGLALVLDAKARREEAWLIARHPAYRAYRTRTRRFIPGIY
jgi:protein-S-isoprenylcysteine O-methyltransferase Ste14